MAIADKRDQAKRKLANVQRKMARLKREKGAEIAGTSYDVRVSPDKLKRYNSKQLDAFINRADQFLSRKTQFVGLRNGKPAPANKANRLAELDNAVNERGNRVMNNIGGFKAPFTGMTIAERNAQMLPTKRAGGEIANSTFPQVSTRIQNLESIEALDAMIQKRESQLRKDYAPNRIKTNRRAVDEMLLRMGADESRETVNKLSDEQFYVWFEHGPYVNDIGLQYSIIKESNSSHSPLSQNEAQDLDDIDSEIQDSLRWAQSLPSDLNLGLAEAAKRPGKKRARRRK